MSTTKTTMPTMGKDAARILIAQALDWAATRLQRISDMEAEVYESDAYPMGAMHCPAAVELVLWEVRRMASDGTDLLESATPWHYCHSTLVLALAALGDVNTQYSRVLRGFVDSFAAMSDLWQHIELQGVRQ